ncbi:glycosyltransferase [Nitratidesulfovibrio sp. SRB-5]|uniref:glycosyltransferase n=1 Tax=Nitratidesulfovibrio sp. SRB-5 TaxID=2872636 RepID=UPI0010250625|nr:glycosyltransferase [Nitratidesulfovibrio sp. SRB-5]MBZ2172990.1 glycosyltransferase [Nitratidesulfovibrio sp. SRB-5]RXF78476.1 glycosyltransferase family 1 protein [Desulfovibrio sp. DS-1]
MIKGRDFIVFSDDWGRHPFSCQHVMRHFLPDNRILWVNTIGMRLPRLCIYDVKRAFEKVRSWADPAPSVELPQGLRVISPLMVPLSPLASVRAFNRRSVLGAVARASRDLGLRDPVLLATVPNAADYAGLCGESLVVYYCVDEFSVWPGMNLPEMVRELEADLLRKADLVMAVSDELVARKSNGRSPTRLLTHGVDFGHFSAAAGPVSVADLPEALRWLEGPVIGFYGLIDSHLDIDLLVDLLAARPHWNVVLIGTRRIPLDALERFPNFLWLPAVPYGELPGYAARFDVAVIPYVVNEHTCTANPLKLREYLATGKPVVATPMTEVLRFEGVVRIATSGDAFVAAIEDELHSPAPVGPRWKVLEGETWKDKAELVSCWIEEALAAGGAPRPLEGTA